MLRWPETCEEAHDSTAIHADAALKFHPIAPRRWVVKVDCTLGAYQGYAIYLLLDERVTPPAVTLLQFRTYTAPEERKLVRTVTTELWGQAEIHDDTKELVVWNRYRGPGDCGALVTYALASGRPRVKEFRSKNVCDGLGAEGPGRWPRIPPP